jgi:hypothetical protein
LYLVEAKARPRLKLHVSIAFDHDFLQYQERQRDRNGDKHHITNLYGYSITSQFQHLFFPTLLSKTLETYKVFVISKN